MRKYYHGGMGDSRRLVYLIAIILGIVNDLLKTVVKMSIQNMSNHQKIELKNVLGEKLAFRTF